MSTHKISGMEALPITPKSYPFSSAEKYWRISQYGYVESEFKISGTANVYQTGQHGVEIKAAGVPYVNRIIVRKPAKLADCSGKVVIEILNPTAGMDIDRIWINTYHEIIRRGDIYIGITSKPNTIKTLQEFDMHRYGDLSWPNPTPDVGFEFTRDEVLATHAAVPDQDVHYETGLFWDMLTDLAKLIRQSVPLNPLQGIQVNQVILAGWSQSADYMCTYMNNFAIAMKLFDGFLLGCPPRAFSVPINQYETMQTLRYTKVFLQKTIKPTIILQTESENVGFGAGQVPRNRTMSAEYQCREYDIAGATHDTVYSLLDYYQDDPDLKAIGCYPTYGGQDVEPNNYPIQVLFAGAYHNLCQWMVTGVAPAPAALIVNDGTENQRDAFGNVVGGLRTCLLNYPTGRYVSYSHIKLGTNGLDPNSNINGLFGHEEAFSASMLTELYGSLSHYQELVSLDTTHQVRLGSVLQSDAEYLVGYAVAKARKRGLK
ncbi:hypothetical protein LFAB_15265 [Lactiplantibacillus fabifermentans T30PCM01]|uniref:Alpha/beta hydrolase domain-containing protein n=1 Tax=Lactiplantibacillus fabifermentans T30PCM01 TaxID=1400520 RepID=W6T4Q0_9LACO|nr:alpha/beta hydrolase domain-containing protein [Lactiplantibacillus fabifermentans]ETY72889.1 hypothetical protein LFAB_15265 [Lactiplantibacillus fabifermentans T30PCM01]